MKAPTDRDVIEAKGHMLAFYISDLLYIDNFQKTKNGDVTQTIFLDQGKIFKNSFRQFVWEFRVVRNIRSGQLENLLKETIKWSKSRDANNVDAFKRLVNQKNITHEKDMTSLCSKILFLNNPEIIHPYDDLAKRALEYKGRCYSDYLLKVEEYKKEYKKTILKIKNDLRAELKILDKSFQAITRSSVNSKAVRDNRIVDKLLWTIGKNQR